MITIIGCREVANPRFAVYRPLDALPDLLALSDALDELERADSVAASLVQLRYFAGMSVGQVAQSLGMSARTGYYTWDYARS